MSGLLALLLAVGASPDATTAAATLQGGRSVAVIVNARDVGQLAVRFVPQLSAGAYADFGQNFLGAIAYECWQGAVRVPPTLDAALACPSGARPQLRPDVTLPDDPTRYPTSPVPEVKAWQRPVTASVETLRPWAIPLGATVLACVGLALFCHYRARRCPAVPGDSPPPLTRTDAWIFLGLTALAAVLRLTFLGAEPFEQNEFTYVMSGFGHASLVDVLLDVNAMAQTHPPLPHVLFWLLSGLGNDELIARLPSAVAGIATVPLVALLAFRLDGRKASFAAGLLAAVAPVHVWYSQDASPYTLTTLFAAVALLGAQRVASAPSRARGQLTFLLGTVGLFYSHYYGLHLAAGLWVVLLVRLRSDPGALWRLGGTAALIAAALLPWLPAFVQAYAWSKGHSTAYQRDAGIYHPTANLSADLLDVLRLTAGLPKALAALSLGGLLLFAAALRPRTPSLFRGHGALLLAPALWFIAFELVNRETFLHQLYGGYYFGIRYFLFLFPVAWVIAGLCVARAMTAEGPRWVRPATLGLFVAALLGAGYETAAALARPDKPDVASAADLVTREARSGDAILVGPAVFYQAPWHYYATPERDRGALRINALMATPDWRANGTLGVLTDLVEPWQSSLASAFIRRVWVVDHDQHLFDRPEFSARPTVAIHEALAAQGFVETWRRELHDVRVSLFERRAYALKAPERLHFGWGDGPYIRGVDPPSPWASAGRRIRRVAEIALPEAHRSALRLRLGAAPLGPTSLSAEPPTPVRVMVQLNGAEVGSLEVQGGFLTHTIVVPDSLRNAALVLQLTPEPAPAGRSPSSVVLDWLEWE